MASITHLSQHPRRHVEIDEGAKIFVHCVAYHLTRSTRRSRADVYSAGHLESHIWDLDNCVMDWKEKSSNSDDNRLEQTRSLTRTHICFDTKQLHPFERRLPAKTLDTASGTSGISILVDVHEV